MIWLFLSVLVVALFALATTGIPATRQKRRGGPVCKPGGPAVYVLHAVLRPGARYEIPDCWKRLGDEMIVIRSYDGAWFNRLKMHHHIFAHITQINLATGEFSVYSSSHAER